MPWTPRRREGSIFKRLAQVRLPSSTAHPSIIRIFDSNDWCPTQFPTLVVQNDAVFRKPAAILIAALLIAACRDTPRRPLNVLLITVDTFRADRVGSNTPAIARLAREGIRFDAADS